MNRIRQLLNQATAILLDPKWYPFVATPLVGMAIVVGISQDWFRRPEFVLDDWRMREAAKTGEVDPRLLYIGIDDSAIADLGRWPWERNVHASFLSVLSGDPPGAIAYDIWFPESSGDDVADGQLADAAASVGSGVFAAVARRAEGPGYNQSDFGFTFPLETIEGSPGDWHGDSEAILPYEALAASGFVGFVDSKPDVDCVRRSLPLVVRVGDEIYPGLVIQSLMTYWGLDSSNIDVKFGERLLIRSPEGEFSIPIDQNGEMLISWRSQSSFAYEGFSDLLGVLGYAFREEKPPPKELSNLGERILVVGQNSTALADVGPTPLEADTPLSTTHLNALNTILTRDFVIKVPQPLLSLLWFVIAISGGLFLRDRGALWSAAFPLAMTLIYLIVAQQLYLKQRILLPITWPITSQILLHFGAGTVHWLKEQKQREQIKSIFSTLVSGPLLDHILKNPDAVKLGGELRPVAVFFSDIRSFTTFSENAAPDELVESLNVYFGEMVDCVHRQEGTLHKYIGDAIMAVWGDILDESEEKIACDAVRAALEMRTKLADLNQRWRDAGEMEMHIGMGINFGEVLVGYIGAPERREFTVIGDAVNTASRLEGLTKEFNTDLVIGPKCRELVGEAFVTRLLGQIKVKGRQEPLKVFEVFGESEKIPAELKDWVTQFELAIQFYFDRQFAEARANFEECL
ncbi:MAG: adenylate/guanylate cyclase domain-containing protein, partial [Verrucomicrobiota bacterium]